jgi:general secretion pathway protein I
MRCAARPGSSGLGRHGQGFSLLEVLVAFSILTLTLGVLMQIFSGGIRNTLSSAAYSRAADLAESTLALAGTEYPLEPGMHSGQDRQFQWSLEIAPYQPTDLQDPPQHLALFHVAARVSWGEAGENRSLVLDSLRLTRAQP